MTRPTSVDTSSTRHRADDLLGRHLGRFGSPRPRTEDAAPAGSASSTSTGSSTSDPSSDVESPDVEPWSGTGDPGRPDLLARTAARRRSSASAAATSASSGAARNGVERDPGDTGLGARTRTSTSPLDNESAAGGATAAVARRTVRGDERVRLLFPTGNPPLRRERSCRRLKRFNRQQVRSRRGGSGGGPSPVKASTAKTALLRLPTKTRPSATAGVESSRGPGVS